METGTSILQGKPNLITKCRGIAEFSVPCVLGRKGEGDRAGPLLPLLQLRQYFKPQFGPNASFRASSYLSILLQEVSLPLAWEIPTGSHLLLPGLTETLGHGSAQPFKHRELILSDSAVPSGPRPYHSSPSAGGPRTSKSLPAAAGREQSFEICFSSYPLLLLAPDGWALSRCWGCWGTERQELCPGGSHSPITQGDRHTNELTPVILLEHHTHAQEL